MRIKRPLVCKHSARAGTDLASFVRVSNMEGCRRQVRRTERFERARNTATPSGEDTWGNGQKNQILFISTVIQIQLVVEIN